MTDAQMWDLIIGFVMPLLVAVVAQTHWDQRARAVAMFACCLVAVVLEHLFITPDLSGLSLARSLLVVMVSTIAFYKGWWKPIGTAPAIEQATTLRSTPP